ncbi:MAG: response regulator transcription factor [Ignavibacteriae bacterium]|nr:response regulator transcription factor [Ignavibacteriota bacterium]MCB9208260.1 response regulator transcription factor [Ignavibacteriales bacterium]MCB9259022.1 response regulator transcription factor [Ignavibacteriales bacterium]
MNEIKVFLVDDHAMIREGLKLALNSEKNINVIGESEDNIEIVQKIIAAKPDVVLMDINMPEKDGLTIAKEIKKVNKSIKIIILTMMDNELYVMDALKSNLEGFIYKDSKIIELVDAIQKVYNGEKYFNEEIKNRILDHISSKGELEANYADPGSILTKRQKEIIRLAAKGLTSREIAEKLFLSELTVIKHRKNIIRKLGLKNFTEVVSYSYTNKII